ncbi:MAG: hypothetical protein ACXWHZ_03675 [Usitatibacter sp.]
MRRAIALALVIAVVLAPWGIGVSAIHDEIVELQAPHVAPRVPKWDAPDRATEWENWVWRA